LGKFQPSDKTSYKPHGITSIVGVFITGAILFFIAYLYPIKAVGITHAVGIFSATLAVYFLDHYFDFKIMYGMNDYYTQLNKKLAVVFGVATLVLIISFWSIYIAQWDYYLGAIGLVFYGYLQFAKRIVIRFLKESTIALTAAWVVCVKPGEALDYLGFVSLGIVFFQNVLLYSYFEREIDRNWGFRSSFNSTYFAYKKELIIYIQLVLLLCAGCLFFMFEINKGLAYVSFAYFFISIASQRCEFKMHYRYLIDILLLGVLIH